MNFDVIQHYWICVGGKIGTIFDKNSNSAYYKSGAIRQKALNELVFLLKVYGGGFNEHGCKDY